MGIGKSTKDLIKKDRQHTAMAKGNVPAYCLDCKRNVTPRAANMWLYILGLIFGLLLLPVIVGALILIVTFAYYFKNYKSGGRCPICNGKNLKF